MRTKSTILTILICFSWNKLYVVITVWLSSRRNVPPGSAKLVCREKKKQHQKSLASQYCCLRIPKIKNVCHCRWYDLIYHSITVGLKPTLDIGFYHWDTNRCIWESVKSLKKQIAMEIFQLIGLWTHQKVTTSSGFQVSQKLKSSISVNKKTLVWLWMFEQPWNTSFIDFQCYPIQTSKQTRHIKREKHTRCNPKRSENYLRSCWTCRVREILKIIGLEWMILAEGSYTVYQFLSKPLTLPLRNPINFQERFDARWSVEKPKCFMINSTNYCFLKRFPSVTSVSWWRAFSRSSSKFVRVDNLRAWNKFEFFSLKINLLPDL